MDEGAASIEIDKTGSARLSGIGEFNTDKLVNIAASPSNSPCGGAKRGPRSALDAYRSNGFSGPTRVKEKVLKTISSSLHCNGRASGNGSVTRASGTVEHNQKE